jgi:hypothetical protein
MANPRATSIPTTRAWVARCGGFRAWTGLFAEAAYCKR